MPNQQHPYDPLTSESAVLILVDHQVGLMTGVRDYSTGELKHNVVALAKAAKTLKLPIIVTTTARDSMWGPTFPELVAALPDIEIIDRSTVNAFALMAICVGRVPFRRRPGSRRSDRYCCRAPPAFAANSDMWASSRWRRRGSVASIL
jgi:hypothetical protein